MSMQGLRSGSSAPPEKGFSGLGKMFSRMKTVLRRDRRKSSTLATSGAPAPSATQTIVTTTTPAVQPVISSTSAPVIKPVIETPAPPKTLPDLPGSVRIPRSQIHEERVRRLGERFGLVIHPDEWSAPQGDALRIDKSIRMRVRWQCHLCQGEFGASECSRCNHVRCKRCVRYPPHRTEQQLVASRVRRAAIIKDLHEKAPLVPDYQLSPLPARGHLPVVVLTKPSKTGGQELVHKKPRQRVRRHCHECGSLFAGGSKECSKCNHVRCTDCPRDPPKKDKYPYGYPGDVFGPNSIPHYECHSCKTKFPPAPEPGTACSNCSHPLCGDCPRLKPQKVEPEPDPALLQNIEAKLASVKLGA